MKNSLFTLVLVLVLVSCKTKDTTKTLENEAVVQDYTNMFSALQVEALSKKNY